MRPSREPGSFEQMVAEVLEELFPGDSPQERADQLQVITERVSQLQGHLFVAKTEVTAVISYTQDDAQWGKGLAEALKRKHVQVLLHERDVGPEQIQLARIEEVIGTAHTGILVLSAAAVGDPIVYDQYATLLHEATRRGLQLIPVLHGSASIPVPPMAGTRLWADFRELSRDDHEAKVTALVAAIRDDVHPAEPHIVSRSMTPVEVLDPDLLALWISRHVAVNALPLQKTVIEFDLDGPRPGQSWLVLEPTGASICHSDPVLDPGRYVYVRGQTAALYRVYMGRSNLPTEVDAGQLAIAGPPELVRQFPAWFTWSHFAPTVRKKD